MGNNETIKIKEWKLIKEFYSNLDNQDTKSEVWLIDKILNSNLATYLFPFTTHRVLGMSPVNEYEKQDKFPCIYVICLKQNRFQVEYLSTPFNAKEKKIFDVGKSNIMQLLYALFQRINYKL